jgi:RNA polymerase sigma-70 factor (ECF subfamily)
MEIPHTAYELRDDATLLTQVRRGDEAAIASLYDRYAAVVYAVALRVLHHSSSAEEILEEMFVEIWRRPEEFLDVRGSLGAWLAVVTRNRAINALRRRPSREMVAEISLASIYDLSNETERTALAEKTRAEVAKLPVEQRRAFGMAFFDGLTHTEIAEIIGESPAIVKLKIRDTLLSLRKVSLI